MLKVSQLKKLTFLEKSKNVPEHENNLFFILNESGNISKALLSAVKSD